MVGIDCTTVLYHMDTLFSINDPQKLENLSTY